MWHLSQKRSTNLTLMYSHLTAGKVINLSLNRFRRGNYNMEMQHPEMNNSCHDKKLHQLLRAFIVSLCSVLFAVKCGHGGGDECHIKVGFRESETQQNLTSCAPTWQRLVLTVHPLLEERQFILQTVTNTDPLVHR